MSDKALSSAVFMLRRALTMCTETMSYEKYTGSEDAYINALHTLHITENLIKEDDESEE